MGDGAYEADDVILRIDRPRVRRDLVNPANAPARTEKPVDDDDETHVIVDLDPVGHIAHVVIEHLPHDAHPDR